MAGSDPIIAKFQQEGLESYAQELLKTSVAADTLDNSAKKVGVTSKKNAETIDLLKQSMEGLRNTGKENTEQYKQLEAELNRLTKATTDHKRATDDNSQSIKKVTLDTSNYAKVLKQVTDGEISLISASQLLKQEMIKLSLEGKQNTVQYTQLKNTFGTLKDTIKDVSQEAAQAGSDTRGLDMMVRSVNLGVSAFGALQGVQVLFGQDNKNLQEALVKLNAIMLISNSLQQVGSELTRKDSIFSSIATGIKNAYGKAVNYVNNGLDDLNSTTDQATTEQSNLTDSLDKTASGATILSSAEKDLAEKTKVSTEAQKAQTTAMQAATVAGRILRAILLSIGIGAILIAIPLLIKYIKEWITQNNILNDTRKEAIKSIHGEVSELYKLVAVARDENLTREDRSRAIKELQEKYPDYLKNISLETIGTQETNDAIRSQIELLIKRAQINDLVQKAANAQTELDEKRRKGVSQSDRNKGALTQLLFGFGDKDTDFAKQAFDKDVKEKQKVIDDYNTAITKLFSEIGKTGKSVFTEPIKVVKDKIKDAIKRQELQIDFLLSISPASKQAALEQMRQFLSQFKEDIKKIDKQNPILDLGLKPKDLVPLEITDIDKPTLIDKIFGTREENETERDYRIRVMNETIQGVQGVQASLSGFTNALFEAEAQALEERKKKGLISEKQYAKEAAKLRRQQAIAQKAESAFHISISIAEAIVKALTAGPIIGQILAGITAGLGFAQLAIVLAKPIPQVPGFFKGIVDIPLGKNKKGKDTIPSMLHEGESVITSDATKKNKPLLKLMNEGRFDMSKMNPDIFANIPKPLQINTSSIKVHNEIGSLKSEINDLKQEVWFLTEHLKSGNRDRVSGTEKMVSVLNRFKSNPNL